MNFMDFILWVIVTGNALIAQGYYYDLRTAQFVKKQEVARVSVETRKAETDRQLPHRVR